MKDYGIPQVTVTDLMAKVQSVIRKRSIEQVGTDADHQYFGYLSGMSPNELKPIAFEPFPESPRFITKESGYHIDEFLQYYDEEFIQNAYLGILHRPPDKEGYEHYLEVLRQNKMTRIEILGQLRYSPEGKIKRTRVKGILLPFLAYKLYRIPILGYVFRLLATLIQLPNLVRNFENLDTHIHKKMLDFQNNSNKAFTTFQEAIMENQSAIHNLLISKADRQELENLLAQKADIDLVQELQTTKADRIELEISIDKLNSLKVDTRRFTILQDEVEDVKKQIKIHGAQMIKYNDQLMWFLEEFRRTKSEDSTEQKENFQHHIDQLFDEFYLYFENHFRGTREDIKERQKIYLKYLQKSNAGTSNTPVLDVGCGRGEWLELLKEYNLIGLGIDHNPAMIQTCRHHNLEAIQDDFLEYMQRQKNGSFGAITGFHIVEHLPIHKLLIFLDESLRLLKRGGVLIVETPNPENLFVATCDFYLDLSHQRPLPPITMKFLAKQRGFKNIEIIKIHKRQEPEYINHKYIDELIYRANMELDYALIGHKQ